MNIKVKLTKIFSVVVLVGVLFAPFLNIAFAEEVASPNSDPVQTQTQATPPAESLADQKETPPVPALAANTTEDVALPAATNTEVPDPKNDVVPEVSPAQPVETQVADKTTEVKNIEEETNAQNPNGLEVVKTPNQDDELEQNIDKIKGEIEDKIDAATQNEADVINSINSTLNTGDNVVTDNHDDVSVTTGDISLILALMNLINSNFIALPGGEIRFLYKSTEGDLIGDYVLNPATGEVIDLKSQPYFIDSEGKIIKNDQTNLSTDNDGNLVNNIDLSLDTGSNKLADNSGYANLKTGDINIALNLINFLNSTFVAGEQGLVGVINVLGDWAGNLLVPKDLVTSGNSAIVGSTNFDIKNSGLISNILQFFANTGGNRVSDNSEGADVKTGSINTDINLKTFGNITMIGDVVYMTFVNVLGDWLGTDKVSPEVNNYQTTTQSQSVDNTNTGLLTNTLNIFANTGNNRLSDNNGSASLETGNINLLSNILNFANVNVFGKKIVFLVVNVMGDWKGNIDFLTNSTPETVVAIEDSNLNIVSVSSSQSATSTKSKRGILINESKEDTQQTADSVTDNAPTESQEANIVKSVAGSFDFKEPKNESEVIKYAKRNFNEIIFYSVIGVTSLFVLAFVFKRRLGINSK